MQLQLAYGKQGLPLDLPDDWDVTVIEPRFAPGLPDPAAALRAALSAPMGALPLREQVKATDRVGIVFSDITHATPHGLILPAVLDELAHVPRRTSPSSVRWAPIAPTARPSCAACLP